MPTVFVERAQQVIANGYTRGEGADHAAYRGVEQHRRVPLRRKNHGALARRGRRRHRHHGRLPRPPALAGAIEFCRVLAPYRPYFIEEPVPPENVDAMAEVRRARPVPIATGERLVTRSNSARCSRSRPAT